MVDRMKWIFLVVVLLLMACGGGASDDETQIRDAIAAMQQAVEAGERRQFMTYVAEDFNGGGYDRQGVNNLLRLHMLRNEKIAATATTVDITVFEGGRASATIKTLLTGGSGWIPDRGQRYTFETTWHNGSGDWQLVSGRWDGAAP